MNDGERMEDYGNAVQEELIPAEECCGETGCEHKTALTLEDIEECIVTEVYEKVGLKTTIVVLTLTNGFEVVGTASCVDPANYDHAIGCKIARERAVTKVWELEGYRLQCAIKNIKM